jgi:hypothetical protein
MPQSSLTQRAIALAILAALPLGFAYSGAATVRLYRELFLAPPASGYNASVDGNLVLVNLTSGEQLRAAVADARWPPNDDVVVVVASSNLSSTEVMRFYYSASYLLYPRPLWLTSAPRQARHALVVGTSNPFSNSRSRQLSDVLSLVDFQ